MVFEQVKNDFFNLKIGLKKAAIFFNLKKRALSNKNQPKVRAERESRKQDGGKSPSLGHRLAGWASSWNKLSLPV